MAYSVYNEDCLAKNKKWEKYSWHDTIAFRLDDEIIINNLKKIAEELKLKLLTPVSPDDWIDMPYFLIVANPSLLSEEENIRINNKLWSECNHEMSILFTQKPKYKLTKRVRDRSLKPPKNIDYSYLKNKIIKKREAVLKYENDINRYDSQLFRLAFILFNLMDQSHIVTTEGLCNALEVSANTIHKDICMLRDMINQIDYDRKQKRWIMTFSNYDFKMLWSM